MVDLKSTLTFCGAAVRAFLLYFVLSFASIYSIGAAENAVGMQLAVTEKDLDWSHCISWGDDRNAGAPSQATLLNILGLKPATGEAAEWKTEPLGGVVRHFRIAFNKPIAAGTLCTDYADVSTGVSILKEDAAYPGNLTDNALWTALPSGTVKTLPPSTRIRALRFTHRYSPMPWDAGLRSSRLGSCLILTGRYWDPTRLGMSEWSKQVELQNAAKKNIGVAVDQWIGCWPQDLEIAGIAFLRQAPKTPHLAYLPPGTEEHALDRATTKWVNTEFKLAKTGAAAIALLRPTPARALRLRAQGYVRNQSAPPPIAPLAALKQNETPPETFLPAAPFSLAYQMPMDGFIALNIRDAAGRHVRRLVAEVERSRGEVVEPWDLKDDSGAYVKPGAYTWTAVCRPPLKLTYEMTVYNAGHPPWFAPVPGGGNWMADHTPPRAICAFNGGLLIAAPGAEYGSGIIATDLEGKKIWNGPSHGAERLVSDGRYCYAVNNSSIVRYDPARGFAQKKIFDFSYTPEIPGHASDWIVSNRSGVACRDGKIYVSYDAPSPAWIRSCVHADNVDLNLCFPTVFREKTHETAYGPAERMLATFLTIQSSQQASFGKTASSGPLKRILVLALKKEVPLGSVMIPGGGIQVYALKPGAKLPAWLDPKVVPSAGLDEAKPGDLDLGLNDIVNSRFDETAWVRLSKGPEGQPGVATAAQGSHTRLLAFTSEKLESIDYALVLDRRYRNAATDARLVILEGEKTASGGWTTRRGPDRPISANDPPIAGFVWEKPVSIRGFALLKPMEWAGVAVDVWTGAGDASISDASFKEMGNWREVRVYRKSDNNVKFGWHTDKVVIGDFGEVLSVRAMRVRVIDPPRSPNSNISVFSGGFEGLIAFQPIGKDVDLPKGFAERISIVALPQNEDGVAKMLKHVALPHPGALAFDAKGLLYAKTAAGIVRIEDLETPEKSELVVPKEQVNEPRAILFDAENLMYVLDGKSKTVRGFDPNGGKLVRTIGKPGGRGLGPWDPAHLDVPVSMCLDSNGKIWVVDQHYQPKRISRWSREGTFEKELLGPTNYGGGGYIDPGDRTVVNHLGMKFRIDYATRTWKLESRYNWMNNRNAFSPDRILRAHGHRYMIGDRSAVVPEFNDHGPTLMICEEKEGVAVPIVAAGLLSGLMTFEKSDELIKSYGGQDPDKTSFCWSDLSRDGKIQKDEVQILSGPKFRSSVCVGDDLSLNFSGWRLRAKEIRADGVPIYDAGSIESVPDLSGDAIVNAAGETFIAGTKFLDVAGKVIWTYPDEYGGVGRSNATPFGFMQRPAGVLAGSFSALGRLQVGGEELYCANGNHGDYFAFTRDGLLAATILGGPAGYGRRFFSTPDCEPGETDLSDLRATVEDFRGHVCIADDGKAYAIAGKNHITVLRVDGLERMKRIGGAFEVKAKDVPDTIAWATKATQIKRTLQTPKVFTVTNRMRKPKIDGDIYSDWPTTTPMVIQKGVVAQGVTHESTVASIGYDSENLYLSAKAIDMSPMLNTGQDWKKVFQQGDGFDLHLGLDPKADPYRTQPSPGDIRLIISLINGAPVAVLYRYKVQGAGLGGEAIKFTSPLGEISVDEVVILKGCAIEIRKAERTWVLEAAIPWKKIGASAPETNVTLRGDVGVLFSDPNGVSTVTRMYWANRSNVVMSDLPSEARVIPSLWGEFRFEPLLFDEEPDAPDGVNTLK